MQTLSLDIRRDLDFSLDISGFFEISRVHAISNGAIKPILDEILPELPTLNFSRKIALSAGDFETFPTLDIYHKELIHSPYWQKKFPEIILRDSRIDLVPELEISLDGVDIRELQAIPSSQKFADLFTRKLPLKQNFRRISRNFFAKIFPFLQNRKKQLIYTFASIFLLIFPIVFFVKFSLESGLHKLLSLRGANNFSEVKKTVYSAKNDFERAKFLFLPFSWIPVDSVDMVNRATNSAAEIASNLNSIVSTLPDNNSHFSLKIVENGEESAFRGNSKDIFPTENMGIPLPSDWFEKNSENFANFFTSLQNAGVSFSSVKWENSYAEKMRSAGKILAGLNGFFEAYKNNSSEILTMLGNRDPQRYMIFNQNRDEIRANGGFPGSIVTFTLYKGNILDYRTDDVYYYDWNLYPHVETPPPGIALLSDNYGLRDVNYYPDFRKTLQKANSFVEKSGDSTLTTAIAIHQWLIEEILGIIGPIRIPDVDEDFTDKNFSLLMSLLVENKFAKEKTPKDILFEFISVFGQKIATSGKIPEVMQVIENHWNRGEILMASRTDSTHNFLTSIQKPLPWNSNSQNWIYPIFTSISGNKSDRYIERSIETKTKNLGQCRYETSVSLTLSHKYSKDDAIKLEEYMQKFAITDKKEQEKMRFIQGGGDNQTFVRLYVPKNANLSSTWAEVSEDENAKIFAFTMKTELGKSTQKQISYTQEIDNCHDYNEKIDIFRQPWLHNFLTP